MYLNCHTGFSFQYGTLSIRELFEEAKRCGVRKLALTEINNTASYMELIRLCEENRTTENGLTKYGKAAYDLEVAVGIEFRNPPTGLTGDNQLLYVCLAQDHSGFEGLNRFLSRHNREKLAFPVRAPEFDRVVVIYPFGKIEPELLRPNEYIGVSTRQLRQFAIHPDREAFADRFVLLHPVTFRPPMVEQLGLSQSSKVVYRDYNIHRLLRCIANNTILTKLPAEQLARKEEYMLPCEQLAEAVSSYPELLRNAKRLLFGCSLNIPLHTSKNKLTFTGSHETDTCLLREETRKGYLKRYGDDDTIWRSQIEKELAVINKKGFTTYYLTAFDLIRYAQRSGFAYVGRGSGANSAVAYCLEITNVDPIELDLYFERFLNEERTSPPDFDIDFSWDNRDAIYAYLFSKYGPDHIALLGTHVTYQGKSIVRELGKVFGLPKEEIDQLVEGRKRMLPRDSISEKVYQYASLIIQKELPANLSIHAGGVLITEQPIYAFTATDIPPKGLPVTHFDMHSAEDFGIHKFDILSQRGLGHIKETVAHIVQNQGIQIDINRFREFKEDPEIKKLMRTGRTMGCFYVESPAMRMLLGKLRCDNYITLVAASSIIRPGVASSGMMKAYIERFHAAQAGKSYRSIHPKMDELMAETYGVMVYQEDVIRVAHHFAGLTLTEADVLRRGMSGKYRSREEFQRVKQRFFDGCKERGYDPSVTDRVWFEIESFSGYSFAKGHSASYAVESYQSLYLKAHHPLEFMVGVINNFGGFYQTEFYFHEARLSGAIIEPPCINTSESSTIIRGNRIFVGFHHIKTLEAKWIHHIPKERAQHGLFHSIEDFLARCPGIGLEQLRILIRIGAFRFLNKSKPHLLWESMLFFSQTKSKVLGGSRLFDSTPGSYPLPAFADDPDECLFDQMELLGFPLGDPFRLIAKKPANTVRTADLSTAKGTIVQLTGYLVTTKDTATRKGELMHFGTFYDQEGVIFDTVHFPPSAKAFPFRGKGFYELQGKVMDDFGVCLLDVSRMDKVPMRPRRLPADGQR